MNTPKIFISYARKDAEWAHRFAQALKSYDVDVWLDVDQIRVGAKIEDALGRALKDCDFLVSIITEESAKSPNVFFELGVAVASNKVVIPVVAKNARIPAHLRSRQHLIQTSPKETAKRLVEQLHLPAAAA